MSFLESSIKMIWTPQRKALYSPIQLEDSHLGRSAQIYARQVCQILGCFGYGYEWPRETWVETPKNTNREHHDRAAVLGTIEESSSFACSLSGHPFLDVTGSLELEMC
jgi:hypothetical protein